MTTRHIATLAVAALLLAGCSAPPPTPTGSPAAPSSSAVASPSVATPSPSASGSTPPSTPSASATPVSLDELSNAALREAVEWVLGELAAGATGPSEADVRERFSAEAQQEVPAATLAQVFEQVRAGGPFTPVEFLGDTGASTVSLRLAAKESVILMVGVDDAGKISSLTFSPDLVSLAPTIDSWDGLETELAKLGGTSQVYVADVAGTACSTVHSTAGVPDGGEPAPSGSMFKLLVLAAVADAVNDGALSWDEELPITKAVKSLPSGTLQDRADGSKVTVREAATLMISISDNTAADLLLTAVGQDRIATVATAAGIDTDRVLPLPTTQQVFKLGWQVDDAVRQRWAAATTPKQRSAVLSELPSTLDVPVATLVRTPRWPDKVDWFFTGRDLCRLYAGLVAGEAAADVRPMLASNAGFTPADGVTYQGFKGGSVPGVVAVSFYVETSGGARRVLVLQHRSDQVVADLQFLAIAQGAVTYLGES